MKKLLSLLTISVLSVGSIAPITAMKEYKTTNKIELEKNKHIKLREIKYHWGSVDTSVVDNKDNLYIGTDDGLYVLKAGATTPSQITGINYLVHSLAVGKNNNVYIGAYEGLYVLKAGATTPNQITGISDDVYSVVLDSKNSIYFDVDGHLYVLKSGATTPNQITGISGNIFGMGFDSKDNLYIGTGDGLYVLKAGETTAQNLQRKKTFQIQTINFDSNNNLYIGTDKGLYVLKAGETDITEILNKDIRSLVIDSNNNLYIGAYEGLYFLKAGETTASKINKINRIEKIILNDNDNYLYIANGDGVSFTNINDGNFSTTYLVSGYSCSVNIIKENNLYIGTGDGLYLYQSVLSWTKDQSNFSLVDSTKTKTWTRPDQISVDGEIIIDIANNNIDTVYFDNVIQTQTAKKWHINVKHETTAKDHTLKVDFTIDGVKYTSEITVSMLVHIDPTPTSTQQNLSDLIKNTNIGNIVDNEDETIFIAVNQVNSNVIDDVSQLEITNKDNNKATISAKSDSKSYKGSVDVTYNVVSETVVDLKIKLTPTSSQTITTNDYVVQIDSSNLINPVNTFYYASGEINIEMIKPTNKTIISGVVYGCDDKWNKTSQSSIIDPTSGIKLDGSQLATTDGKYVVVLTDNLGHTNNVYLHIAENKTILEYWNTDNGKQFEMWANANGYDNIRGYSAIQLNKLFETSKSWKQLASNQQIANALADWYKNNAKLVKNNIDFNSQLKSIVPKHITIDNFDTTLYNPDNVLFSITEKENSAKISIKYIDTFSDSFELKIDGSSSKDDSSNKKLSGWAIFGIVIGSVVIVAIIGFLLKRFVIIPYILEPRKEKRNQAILEKSRKEMAEFEEKEKREKGE